MTTLYIFSIVKKQIESLQFSSRKGQLAVDAYRSICEGLQSGDELTGKRTKYGENRISDCVKYDLGSGYRLVTIRQNGAIHLVCVGSHDDVDNWLERNRRWQAPVSPTELIQIKEERYGVEKIEYQREPDLYEEDLLKKVDEDVLKYVFAGLFTNKKAQVL